MTLTHINNVYIISLNIICYNHISIICTSYKLLLYLIIYKFIILILILYSHKVIQIHVIIYIYVYLLNMYMFDNILTKLCIYINITMIVNSIL